MTRKAKQYRDFKTTTLNSKNSKWTFQHMANYNKLQGNHDSYKIYQCSSCDDPFYLTQHNYNRHFKSQHRNGTFKYPQDLTIPQLCLNVITLIWEPKMKDISKTFRGHKTIARNAKNKRTTQTLQNFWVKNTEQKNEEDNGSNVQAVQQERQVQIAESELNQLRKDKEELEALKRKNKQTDSSQWIRTLPQAQYEYAKNGIIIIIEFDDLELFTVKCDHCNVMLFDGNKFDWTVPNNRKSVKAGIQRHMTKLEHRFQTDCDKYGLIERKRKSIRVYVNMFRELVYMINTDIGDNQWTIVMNKLFETGGEDAVGNKYHSKW
eukprot:309058_1